MNIILFKKNLFCLLNIKFWSLLIVLIEYMIDGFHLFKDFFLSSNINKENWIELQMYSIKN